MVMLMSIVWALQEKKERGVENAAPAVPGDRFIPCRSGMDMEIGHYYMTQGCGDSSERKKRPPFYYGEDPDGWIYEGLGLLSL
jgi:hypothetical protein